MIPHLRIEMWGTRFLKIKRKVTGPGLSSLGTVLTEDFKNFFGRFQRPFRFGDRGSCS